MDDYTRVLSKQYAEYVKVDLTKDVKSVEESIDETLIRLEEFAAGLDMVRSNFDREVLVSLLSKKDELNLLFDKVERLEYVVTKVKKDVNKMEEIVNKAEDELGLSTEGKLLNIFRPLFKRSNTVPMTSRGGRTNQTGIRFPELYKTQDFFPSSNDKVNPDETIE